MIGSLRRVGLGLIALAGIMGCGPGGPEIARVQGTITMDGKPLPAAVVMFVPERGRPSACETDDSGNYVLEFTEGRMGAIPGKNRVEINTARLAYEKDGKQYPAVKESVPAKYNRNTELEFNVEPKKTNIANFDLKSGGKIIQENAQ